MSDDTTTTPPDTGDSESRVEQAIAAAKQAADDLRTKLTAKADDLAAGIDRVSDAVDEVQAAWEARRSTE